MQNSSVPLPVVRQRVRSMDTKGSSEDWLKKLEQAVAQEGTVTDQLIRSAVNVEYQGKDLKFRMDKANAIHGRFIATQRERKAGPIIPKCVRGYIAYLLTPRQDEELVAA